MGGRLWLMTIFWRPSANIGDSEKAQFNSANHLGPPAPSSLHRTSNTLLSVWWDIPGYYENGNSEIYWQKLNNLNIALQQKWPAMINKKDIILLHDNARPEATLGTRQKLVEGRGRWGNSAATTILSDVVRSKKRG